MPQAPRPMLEALQAPQANPALASKLHLYGRFVGSWALEMEMRARRIS